MSQIRVHDWLSSLTANARTLRAECGRVSRDFAARLRTQAAHGAAQVRDARRTQGSTNELGRRVTEAIDQLKRRMPTASVVDTREHLRTQGLVLTWVATALVLRYLLGADETAATFIFYPVVVAFAAWRGGWTSGLVASLASVVVIRLVGSPGAWTSALFVGESLVLTAIVVSLTSRLRDRAETLDAANRRIGELQLADAHARTLDVAIHSLETQTPEYAVVLLDRQGLIVEWRAGAQQLYGLAPDAVRGVTAAMLFPDGHTDVTFRSLLADAQRGTVVRKTAWQRRGDGTFFEADVELAMTVPVGGDGFAMIIRDRTLEHERQASAAAVADSQRELRTEADVAQRHLAALQSVTDPSLNGWAPSHLVAELLERVRDAVQADGIALVLTRGAAARVFSTPDGLHPDGMTDRPLPDLSGQAISRIVLVQNDPARVTEQSLLCWPEGTASLLSVPVVYAGNVEGTLEVVDRRGRRSTEWEIALLQVVAARVAGLARDHGYADSAVA